MSKAKIMDKIEDAKFKIKHMAQIYKHKSDARKDNDILHAAYHHIGQGLLKALSIIEGGKKSDGIISGIISESEPYQCYNETQSPKGRCKEWCKNSNYCERTAVCDCPNEKDVIENCKVRCDTKGYDPNK